MEDNGGGRWRLGGGAGRGELGAAWLLWSCDVVASPGAPVYKGSDPRDRKISESYVDSRSNLIKLILEPNKKFPK
jgi:hypothetical protein